MISDHVTRWGRGAGFALHAMPCHGRTGFLVGCSVYMFGGLHLKRKSPYGNLMPCHAMPCHAMPCHAMPCHAMPCNVIMMCGVYVYIYIYIYIHVHDVHATLTCSVVLSKGLSVEPSNGFSLAYFWFVICCPDRDGGPPAASPWRAPAGGRRAGQPLSPSPPG